MVQNVACPGCGQRLEFEVEDWAPGLTTACPTCGSEVVLIPPVTSPPMEESEPQSMDMPDPPPVAPAPPPQAVVASRHLPFWSTLGVQAALAVTVVGLVAVFASPTFWASFQQGPAPPRLARQESQEQMQPQSDVTPKPDVTPLTDNEKAIVEAFLASDWCRQEHDPFERRTRYSVAAFRTPLNVDLSFNRKDSGEVEPLNISLLYENYSFLHYMRTVKVLVGETLFQYPISNPSGGWKERPVWPAYVWRDTLDELQRTGSSQKVEVRVQGRGGRIDHVLSERHIEDLNSMVLLYRYFGGVW